MLTLLLLVVKAWLWTTVSTVVALLTTMAAQRIARAWSGCLRRVRSGRRRSQPGAA